MGRGAGPVHGILATNSQVCVFKVDRIEALERPEPDERHPTRLTMASNDQFADLPFGEGFCVTMLSHSRSSPDKSMETSFDADG